MRNLIACLLAAIPAAEGLAQCPVLFNCPQGSPVVCDISGNDSLLWKDAPYTWSQAHGTVDLYEGVAEFALKVLPCSGGGNVNISYTLLLDLDNDNLRETAVSSLQFPPSGIVYAGNAFNPNYSGGEPLEFDKRTVPDSLKFRFALEITPSWDTLLARLCWQSGSLYVSPRLPEGRHHLIWRIEQDGVVKYCEHSFRIKDCQAPTIECAAEWSVSLETGGSAPLFFNDVFEEAEDNTTPFPLLEFSMRHAGDGSGFPTDSSGLPVATLLFDCEALDTQMVELWVKDRNGNTALCETTVIVTDDDGVCEVPPLLCASPFWAAGDVMKPVAYKMLWVDTAQKLVIQSLPLQADGCGMMNFLPPASSFALVAECDTNPLNGVSTFDLLLISKHIIGVQPFDAPWKWLAADANKSNSVTTFDVVELRKLILGIYDKLPVNTAWRFFPADCDFPANPFSTYCPPEYSFTTLPLWNYPPEIPFLAVKTGDVNGTANPNAFNAEITESRGESAVLVLPDITLKAGTSYDIPIKAATSEAWSGFQMALQFDPKSIEIEYVVADALPGLDERSWALLQPGRLNISWFDALSHSVLPGDTLFRLKIRALVSAPLSEVVKLSTERLRAEAYSQDNAIRKLHLQFTNHSATSVSSAVFSPQPNPTNTGVVIPLHLSRPGMVSVEVTDISGRIVFQTERSLDSGSQMLEIPATAFPTPGLYAWRVNTGNESFTGKIVRY